MSAHAFTTCLILTLCPQIGDPAYARREKATQLMHKLLPLSFPYLDVLERDEDTEVAVRAKTVADEWYRRTAAQRVKRLLGKGKRFPWIDPGLPYGWPYRQGVIEHYCVQAQRLGYKDDVPYWNNYRHATRLFLTDHLAWRCLTESEARALLDEMWMAEMRWIRDHRTSYSPPLPFTR